MHPVLVVLCTFPDAEKARATGTALVEARLAACVNLLPGIESIYRWQGAVESATEVLAVFKTHAGNWPAFEERLKALHPYEVPEIIALRPEQVAESYARWIAAGSGPLADAAPPG
ncbi:MAG: divalent-cation tolerance protein CutA [Verrucomicrobiaceae bacterium]|jgi:periplasmic divalent cation tolerance protein|nr:divalent-cation tolerance protein CutA [Verrucomicrobiaceae bacterium]